MPALTAPSIVSVIGALIADELNRLPNQSAQYDPHYLTGRQWSADTIITTENKARGQGDEIILDSFDWMSVAGRVVEFFQLHSSGLEDYLLRASTLGEWAEVIMASREQASQDIRFSSSGSTGKPKKLTHSFTALVSEAEFFAELIQQQGLHPKRFISVVPAHHIYGFIFSILLPQQLGVKVVRGLRAFTLTQGQQLQPYDAVIGFPGWYQQLAQRRVTFPEHTFAINSAGPASQNVLETLQNQGLEAVLEVYGSSETAGLGYRMQRNGWYQLLPRWQRYTEQQLLDTDSNQHVALPDKVEWRDESCFKPLKRVDQAVQVNGHNVYPLRVARIIEQHPQIKSARVRLLSDSDQGLKALLVLEQGSEPKLTEPLLAELPGWLSVKLQSYEIPKRFSVADQVPVNEIGKEQDWDVE
ncbi:AMP-binding protein [Idiomarina seosinensis]|uniref:AMP-binding protein n=1 Tax=Idiomarina seosinensis TaxID=281739 RepID=UPI00384C90C1